MNLNPLDWWQSYKDRRWLTSLAKEGKGYAVRVWPLTATSPSPERQRLADQLQQWLQQQLSTTATPYGVSTYLVGVGFVQQVGTSRTPLQKESFSIPQRVDAPTIFEQAADYVATAMLPDETSHVEVYLLSFGDMLKQQTS